MEDPLDDLELAAIELFVDEALRAAVAEIEAVVGVERGQLDVPFWYVRMEGEAKQHFSAEFTLGQRTLAVESYFMPAPEENHKELFEHLLVRNRSMYPLHFVIGKDGGIYLRGQVDNRQVTGEVLDRLLASVYEYSERYFAAAMKIGFASRFRR